MTDSLPPLPLNTRGHNALNEIRNKDLSLLYQKCNKQFNESMNQLLDTDTEPGLKDELVKSFATSYHSMQEAKLTKLALDDKLVEFKRKCHEVADRSPPVTSDNWKDYESGRPNIVSITQIFNETKPVIHEKLQNSNDEKLLRIFPFLWNDPTAVIPDDDNTQANEEEQELQINGGNIELICPITMKTFELPMISKKCNHVFDKEGLTSYLQGQPTRDCPQAGCSQTINMRDFMPDKLMELRCRIAKIKEHDTSSKLDQAIDVI